MNKEELNGFIERYAKEYKTKTAMLLSGEWGTGKSYYITKSLLPHLKKKNVHCIVVSLYGIDDISDLSKQIYLQLRLPNISKKSEAKEYASIIGSNIVNNLLSLKGIKLSISDKQLLELYKSVNLNDILLIFEDAERSSIDMIQLLGYINGLVEYDGAKVLLVANEKEMLGLSNDNNVDSFLYDNNNETLKATLPNNVDDKAVKYRKIKEKTIGDTIYYVNDRIESVESIIGEFSGCWIDYISEIKEIEKIAGIVAANCNNNLRVLIYALQKYNDIFSSISHFNNFIPDFYKATFEGMLIVSNKFIKSDVPVWEGSQYISAKLGHPSSPVFRFVYDYLSLNTISEENVVASEKEYRNYIYFDNSASRDVDDDLYIIDSFYIQQEKCVIDALSSIERKLHSINYMGIHAYEKMAYRIIQSGEAVAYDIDNILNLMISNASKMCKKSEFSSQSIIWGIYCDESESEGIKAKYNDFIIKLSKAIDEKKHILNSFSYKPEDINTLYKDTINNKHIYYSEHRFISKFDVQKIIKMLLKSSSCEIHDFRGVLLSLYREAPKGVFDIEDKRTMSSLKMMLEQKLRKNNNWDKIQTLQIGYLISNLDGYIIRCF